MSAFDAQRDADRELTRHREAEEWDTAALQRDFTVLGFAMGLCVVRRKSDGVTGSLRFDHMPRRYYGWAEDK